MESKMARYFIEVSYLGTQYGGFQIQKNVNTVQAEIERALEVYLRKKFELTGSSRTDAGVHAYQNYFHFDSAWDMQEKLYQAVYHVNAILPEDIVVKRIVRALDHAHCRFDALSRTYEYRIYNKKNPFIKNQAYYFPYPLNLSLMEEAAEIIRLNEDFQSFSKKNTQVYTYVCNIQESHWEKEGDMLIYRVRGNRFLRGMVRGLVGTMLKVGTNKLDIARFRDIFPLHDCSKVDFSAPAHGLTLLEVNYYDNIFDV